MFKQLFPTIDPYAAGDRFRAHEAIELVGEVYSYIGGEYPRSLTAPNVTDDYNIEDILSDVTNYRSDLMADTGDHFTSWPQKYGPEVHNGDTFSSRLRCTYSSISKPRNGV